MSQGTIVFFRILASLVNTQYLRHLSYDSNASWRIIVSLAYLRVDGSAVYVETDILTHPSGVLPHWDPASSRHANRYTGMP